MKFQIYGERGSGTNFLEQLVSRNLEGAEITFEHGFKHWFPNPSVSIAQDIAVLVIYREPFAWLRSMHRLPFHAAPNLKGLDFSSFIRTEWMCVYDAVSGIRRSDPLYGTELMHERNPDTGERFENVVKLRTAKIQAFERLRETVPQIHYIRYEDLSSNPAEFLQYLAKRYELTVRSPIDRVMEYKGAVGIKTRLLYRFSGGLLGRHRRVAEPPISSEDQQFILENLSLPLEQSIGYLTDNT